MTSELPWEYGTRYGTETLETSEPCQDENSQNKTWINHPYSYVESTKKLLESKIATYSCEHPEKGPLVYVEEKNMTPKNKKLKIENIFLSFKQMGLKVFQNYGGASYFFSDDILVIVSLAYKPMKITKKRFRKMDTVLMSTVTTANVSIEYFENSHFVKKVQDYFNENFIYDRNKNVDKNVYVVGSNGRLNVMSLNKIKLPRQNYNDSTLEDFDYIANVCGKQNPFGRLAILYGEPGTGKTHLIKSLVSKTKIKGNRFIYMSVDFLRSKSSDSLVDFFMAISSPDVKNQGFVFLIEDADEFLVKREENNMASISKILNITDGFVGEALNIKIIATTNSKNIDIDPAIKRPGRLIRMSHVGPLVKDKANIIYQTLSKTTDKPFEKDTVLAEVYEKANEADNRRERMDKKSTPMGF